MNPDYIQRIKQHNERHATYSQRDFIEHFSDKQALDGLRDFMRRHGHKPLKFFQSSDDWQALVPPAFQAVIAEYGMLPELPEGLITVQSEDRDHTVKRFVWQSEQVEDYLEGESFKEFYHEAGTALVRWRKPGAMIVQSYEAASDVPLSTVQTTLRLAMNEMKKRQWQHFTHELHKSTSNKFDTRATDKHGSPLNISGWRDLFENAYDDGNGSTDTLLDWNDVRDARQAMLRRERDAVRPNVLIVNATTEAELSTDEKVLHANLFGGADTYFRTGTLPNIYGLQVVVVPDSLFGYFNDDITRKSNEFILSNDGFLLTNQNGPVLLRHTREPMSTETWRIYDGQKQAMSVWERFDYGTFRYTNIMRIIKAHDDLEGQRIALD